MLVRRPVPEMHSLLTRAPAAAHGVWDHWIREGGHLSRDFKPNTLPNKRINYLTEPVCVLDYSAPLVWVGTNMSKTLKA